jgi:septation ring formation regulator EzrA
MYFDHAAAEMQRNQEESFEKLKSFIKTQEGSEFLLASFHIQSLENEMEKQAKQIDEYRKFFATLQHFLPRQPSIHDVIG